MKNTTNRNLAVATTTSLDIWAYGRCLEDRWRLEARVKFPVSGPFMKYHFPFNVVFFVGPRYPGLEQW